MTACAHWSFAAARVRTGGGGRCPAASCDRTRIYPPPPVASCAKKPAWRLARSTWNSSPATAPRGAMRVVTVAYLALAADLPAPQAGTDAADARWRSVEQLREHPGQLAFDHADILRDGVEAGSRKARIHPAGRHVLPARIHRRRAAPDLRNCLGSAPSTPAISTARSLMPKVFLPQPGRRRLVTAGGPPSCTAAALSSCSIPRYSEHRIDIPEAKATPRIGRAGNNCAPPAK